MGGLFLSESKDTLLVIPFADSVPHETHIFHKCINVVWPIQSPFCSGIHMTFSRHIARSQIHNWSNHHFESVLTKNE